MAQRASLLTAPFMVGVAARCGMTLTPICAPGLPGLPCAARLVWCPRRCSGATPHEIYDPMGRGKRPFALWNSAGLLGLEVREQRLLIAIPEGQGVEIGCLAVKNMLGQCEHVRRDGEVRQIAEVIIGFAHLIGV